jgi:diguanylate cyclase (GGDEF)-like protein
MDAKDMSALEQGWFHDAPYPMLATDDTGRIRWANRALEGCVGLPASQLLGHDRESLPAPAYRVLLDAAELIHLQGPGAPERWLKCTRCSSRSVNGVALQLHCYQDVTAQRQLEIDNRQLREALNDLQLNDPLTGLPNERALSQALNQQVSRSRRYDNPLSTMLIHVPAPSAGEHSDVTLQALARLLRDRLRWVDQLGRWREDAFLAILPETSEADAQQLADKIHASLAEASGDADHPLASVSVSFGLAAWRKGDDARTLLRRATHGVGSGDLARLG